MQTGAWDVALETLSTLGVSETSVGSAAPNSKGSPISPTVSAAETRSETSVVGLVQSAMDG